MQFVRRSIFSFLQVRVEIQRAKLELLFKLQRLPTEEEIIEKVGISPERYHEVMRASKSVLSLHARHATTQEEYINGITDVEGVGGDRGRQLALLRLALDDVVILCLLQLESNHIVPIMMGFHSNSTKNLPFCLSEFHLCSNKLANELFLKLFYAARFSEAKGELGDETEIWS